MLSVPRLSTLRNHIDDQPIPVSLQESRELANRYFDLTAIETGPLHEIAFTLHVSGSSAYNIGLARDFDGLIITETYHDILRVLKEPSSLAMLLRIRPEEGTDALAKIATECLAGTVPKFFEAVRFSGISKDGQKRSVKLMARDSLRDFAYSPDGRCHGVPTLSCKDKRLFEAPGGRVRMEHVSVHSTLPLFVLHDADLFAQVSTPHSETALPAFGCLVDLFMTGRVMFYHQTGDVKATALDILDIQYRFFSKYTMLAGPNITTLVDPSYALARCLRFSPEYRIQMNEKYKTFSPTNPSDVPPSPSELLLLWPSPNAVRLERSQAEEAWKLLGSLEPWGTSPERDFSRFLLPSSYREVAMIKSAGFSQNSSHGTLSTPFGPVFWKMTTSWENEVAGSHMLSSLYPRSCHRPIKVDPSIVPPRVIYPFIEGSTLSSIRARFLSSHKARGVLVDNDSLCILAASMTRAEDVLAGWTKSITSPSSSTSAVYRFYTERLNDNARMRAFYGSGVAWESFSLTLDELLEAPITINGVKYSSLGDSFQRAEKTLQEHRDNPHLQIVGHGDLHGGNVIVQPPPIIDSTANPHLKFVDYDVAGSHSPWLDVAKPIYIDTFFYYLYADILGEDLFASGEIKATLDGDGLHIVFSPARRDPIARATFQILVEALLKPFEASLADLHPEWVPFSGSEILPQALLACAVLARDFSSRPDVFFGNLAIGMILAKSEPSQLFDVVSSLL